MAQRKGGHPAKQDPQVAKLFKAMVSVIELTRDIEPKLTDEGFLALRASGLGLMHVYAEVANLPAPDDVIKETFKSLMDPSIKTEPSA